MQTYVSVIIVKKENQENFAPLFLQVFEKDFLRKISHIHGKEWPIKAR